MQLWIQGLRGDQTSRNEALAKFEADVERMHKSTVLTLIPSLNERLRHRCGLMYTREVSDISSIRTVSEYVQLHQRSLQAAKDVLRQVSCTNRVSMIYAG